jgi:deazaflavin-dependent oxidoreductase (nitroreductase family)
MNRRRMSRWERAQENFAKSKAGAWFFVHVASRIDPPLLRASRGKVSIAVGQPVALLTHRGAKSGVERRTPLLYVDDGDRLVFIASNGGSPRHPAWYHNLRAHPEVRILSRKGERAYVAREAEGPEREELWRRANDLYGGYDTYQQRAGDRRIPVIVCEPRS